MLQSMGLQRVGQDLATEQQLQNLEEEPGSSWRRKKTWKDWSHGKKEKGGIDVGK